MTSAEITPLLTAIGGALVAAVIALVKGAVASRAKESEELRDLRLTAYPVAWKLTSAVPRWPRAQIGYDGLWTLHKALRQWYFETGGLFLSENSRARYGEVQELLDALLKGRPDDDQTNVGDAYTPVMETCSSFRTSLTEDLATRRARSVLWAAVLWWRHRQQRLDATARIDAVKASTGT
jgi:hypothetical protein